jgi:hypothetical protein
MADRFNCPVCLDKLAGARVARCGHLFCGTCYYEMVHRSAPHPSCAVCRAPLAHAKSYPCYEVDAELEPVGDALFQERVAQSRARALLEEHTHKLPRVGLSTHAIRLQSDDPLIRRAAMTAQLATMELVGTLCCATMHGGTLRRLVRLGTQPENVEELTLAWRILAHVTTYFHDAGVLLNLGVHTAAAEALVHELANTASRRAATRVVAALVATHRASFAFMLTPEWLARLADAAPAAVAHVAIFTTGGIARMAEDGVLSPTLSRLVATERVLARDTLDAALECEAEQAKSQVRMAAATMLLDPLMYASPIATICWRDEAAARVIATCHQADVQLAVRTVADSDNFEAQAAVLDMLHALNDQAGFTDALVMTDVLRWMRRAHGVEHTREYGFAFVSTCVRASADCARAAAAEFGTPQRMVEGGEEHLFYLAGDVFSHEAVATEYLAPLAELLPTLAFDTYPAVYLASSLSEHPTGARLVERHALDELRRSQRTNSEAHVATVEEILERCSQ